MEKCLFLLKCNGCGLCSGVLYSPEITVTPFPPSLFQWKVRRTLAFSIHELAVILGDQLTAADLVPIFNGFLKDLDEVRIGVLKHLYDFLKVSLEMCQLPGNQQTADKARVHCFLIFFFFLPQLLHADKRREYLYQLQEFMVTDNSRNWRFRYELAEYVSFWE